MHLFFPRAAASVNNPRVVRQSSTSPGSRVHLEGAAFEITRLT
jgi:hypothetical protein